MPDRSRGALVILPTFNERETLAEVVDRVLAQVPEAEVLIIDDASPDGTGLLADRLASADPRITVLHRSGKQGLGTAYTAGFRAALDRGFGRIVQMDSDGSHLPEELPALLAAADAGAGLVVGARWIQGGVIENWPRYRQWVSRVGTKVARVVLRSRLRDLTSGFRVIDTAWITRLNLDDIASEGYGFQVESAWMLERLGCPITEVPITFVERAGGHSKMSIGIVAEALVSVLKWGVKIRLPQSASEMTP